MALKRILILVAIIFELLAAVGFGEFHLGTVTLSLIAAGLAAYFLSEFV